MKTTLAGPSGNVHPGTVVDLPDEQAQAMVNGRFAERVDPVTSISPVVIESATLVPEEVAAVVKKSLGQMSRNRRGAR